jgi:hypothetical protein
MPLLVCDYPLAVVADFVFLDRGALNNNFHISFKKCTLRNWRVRRIYNRGTVGNTSNYFTCVTVSNKDSMNQVWINELGFIFCG